MKNSKILHENILVMNYNQEKVYDSLNAKFPFNTSLNFTKLINHIEGIAKGSDKLRSAYARSILDEFGKSNELHGAIKDESVTERHKDLINNLMTFVFPNAFYEMQTYAASTPYSDTFFYASTKFRNLIKSKVGVIDGELNIDKASYIFGKILSGYAHVLDRFYGFNFKFEFPLIYKIIDPVTGLDRYFKINGASEFVDLQVKGELKKLSKKEIESISTKFYDLDYLEKILEPGNFEFSGIYVMNIINITSTEIISSIKKELIEKDTLTSFAGVLKLQHMLKSLLDSPGLLFGITDFPGSKDELWNYGRKIGNSFLMNDNCIMKLKSIEGSIYEYSIDSRKPVIVEDLLALPDRSRIEEKIIEQGIRNILIAPLILDDKIVGILEVGAPEPGKINLINTLKLREVLPLFAIAIERSREDLKNKVRNVIKEKCTAIHPTLEWKFQKAALKYIQDENDGLTPQMEEIIFENVYPLYGLSDIRNSSLLRNEAIRDDLTENLELAKKVILSAKKYKKLKIFDELIFRIEKKINSLQFGIDSGDESEILKFLRKKIITLFEHLQSYDPEVKNMISDYNAVINAELGIVYNKRKLYDESINKLTGIIASYLDEEQSVIQNFFPHYFERYKTDGVDHSIYIGSSLTEEGVYDRIYLRNLRLWQLIAMCGIVRKTKEIKKDLSMDLETAHLILVQDNPLSIKFRFDEKKFDVDGAYNVRYEIMKKRIDKAEIKGKRERLTQPGKIAIVFSQNSEAQEYMEYIEYLQSQNFVNKEIEEIEIEDLQGITGLKALRIEVNTDKNESEARVDAENIKEVVKKMSLN